MMINGRAGIFQGPEPRSDWTKMSSKKLKVAIIGQSAFASEVYKLIRSNGHEIVGVFTVPDVGNRQDPLGE